MFFFIFRTNIYIRLTLKKFEKNHMYQNFNKHVVFDNKNIKNDKKSQISSKHYILIVHCNFM